MEGLELNAATLLTQHVHHEFEVVGIADITRHHIEIVAIKQQFAQELKCTNREVNSGSGQLRRDLERLTTSHVVLRAEQSLIRVKELVIIYIEEFRTQSLVLTY
jgi:hypothetical protein